MFGGRDNTNHEVEGSYSDEYDRYGVNHDNARVEPHDSDHERNNPPGLLGINRWIH